MSEKKSKKKAKKRYLPKDAKFQKMLNAIAKNVVKYRSDNNISIRRLAAKSELSLSTLTDLEGGSGNPKLETLYRISSTTGTPIQDLLNDPKPNYTESLQDLAYKLRKKAEEIAYLASVVENHVKEL